MLVTGSTVLVADDLSPRFDAAADEWLARKEIDVELDFGEEDGFHVVSSQGSSARGSRTHWTKSTLLSKRLVNIESGT